VRDGFNIPLFNVQTQDTFKNIYCVLCHDQNNTVKQNLHYLNPWNMSLVCPRLMFPLSMPSMKSILRSAEQNNCTIYFTSTNADDNCIRKYDSLDTINKCNVTGMALSVSEDARKMCEDPTMTVMATSRNYIYKNQICDVCNSEIFEDPISKCYLEGYYKPYYSLLTQNNCENGNVDNLANYPFRNAFCQKCNTPTYSRL
jgi:hypothetical protein